MKNKEGKIVWEFRCMCGQEMMFCNIDGTERKFVHYSGNGEVHLFLHVVGKNAPDLNGTEDKYHDPPSHVSVITGAGHNSEMDDLSAQFTRVGTEASPGDDRSHRYT